MSQLKIQQLQEEIFRLEADLKKADAENCELKAYKHQLEAIFNNAPAEIYLKDREGRYLKINRQFEKIFGVKNEDLIGKLPFDAHDPDLAQSTRDQDLTVLTTGRVQRREEKARLVTDDQLHTLLTIKFPVFNEFGEIDGLGAVVTDITEQKQAEERFIDIVNTLDGIIWESDVGVIARTTFISEKVTQFLGFSVEECLQTEFWDQRFHPQDRNLVQQTVAKYHAEDRDSYQLEYRLITSNGKIKHVRDLVSVARENGKIRWLRGIVIDITAQKQAETARLEAEERFRKMFVSAPIGIVLADIESSELADINPEYCQIVGRDAEEIKSIGWQALIHPDDLRKDLKLFEQFRSGKTDAYNLEKRYIRPDGESVWVLCRTCHIDPKNTSGRQYLVMVEDITKRKSHEAKIWQQANYDSLTGLPNRNMLVDRLDQLIMHESRGGGEFAMFLIDLDGFKDINDTRGHDKGDELLIEVSKRIKFSLRSSDTVARLGGDEFVVIVSDLTKRHDVNKISQNIIETISRPYEISGEKVFISASIGITIFPEDGEDVITLIRNADQAMYAAKHLGRGRYQYFTEDMQLLAQRRMQTIAEMRKALSEQQFILFYQPIINLGNGEICKAEALLRWQHDIKGLVGPVEFIPLAEEAGLINEIGDQVFSLATHDVNVWKNALGRDLQVTINVSPVQFETPNRIANYLSAWKRTRRSICIEITENVLMSPSQTVVDLLLKFRDTGVQVALDDFGTGYSSLSYLRKFDIDFVKIDRSFIQNIDNNKDDLALCEAIIIMAHTLGIKVIAEGIETDQQLRLLIGIGCDYGQGYHLCKPLPVDEFKLFVKQHNRTSGTSINNVAQS